MTDGGTGADVPMTAIVEFKVREETTSVEEWLAEWDHRGLDALNGEPETSAYATAVNVEDPLNVVVFEKYTHGAASIKAHMERPAHAALTEAMGERRMTKRRMMAARFDDIQQFGWWSRSDADPTAAGVIIVVLGFRFETDAARDTYFELTAKHAEYCWEHEPDTLIYSAGIAPADGAGEIDVLAGDVVFVMACTDGRAVGKHANDAEHIALGEKFAASGISVEPHFMLTYKTTGNGYLWRS